MRRELNISVAPKTNQINFGVEKALLDIFRSEKKRKPQKWLREQLEKKGVEAQFAHLLACFEGVNKRLLELSPLRINLFIYSLIKEFREAGFCEKTALINPGRLRELERLGLPVTARTIHRNPQILLKNKQELERLGLPVNTNTIDRNPQTLLKNKQELEKLGLPVNTNTMGRNPQTLLKNKQELEKLGLPVNTNTIHRNPQTLVKRKKD